MTNTNSCVSFMIWKGDNLMIVDDVVAQYEEGMCGYVGALVSSVNLSFLTTHPSFPPIHWNDITITIMSSISKPLLFTLLFIYLLCPLMYVYPHRFNTISLPLPYVIHLQWALSQCESSRNAVRIVLMLRERIFGDGRVNWFTSVVGL